MVLNPVFVTGATEAPAVEEPTQPQEDLDDVLKGENNCW